MRIPTLGLAIVVAWGALAMAQAEPVDRPSQLSAVAQQVVDAVLSQREDYLPGDLITSADAQLAVKTLSNAGWPIADAESIPQRVPADSSWIQQTFAKPGGRKFLRRVAESPGGYAAAQRVASSRGGEQAITQIMQRRGGHELIAYLATTPNGRRTSRGLPGQSPDDEQAIFTAADLVRALSTPVEQPR